MNAEAQQNRAARNRAARRRLRENVAAFNRKRGLYFTLAVLLGSVALAIGAELPIPDDILLFIVCIGLWASNLIAGTLRSHLDGRQFWLFCGFLWFFAAMGIIAETQFLPSDWALFAGLTALSGLVLAVIGRSEGIFVGGTIAAMMWAVLGVEIDSGQLHMLWLWLWAPMFLVSLGNKWHLGLHGALIALEIWLFCQAFAVNTGEIASLWSAQIPVSILLYMLGGRLVQLRRSGPVGKIIQGHALLIGLVSLLGLCHPVIQQVAQVEGAFSTTWLIAFGFPLILIFAIAMLRPSGRSLQAGAPRSALVILMFIGLVVLNFITWSGILPGWIVAGFYFCILMIALMWSFRSAKGMNRQGLAGIPLMVACLALAMLGEWFLSAITIPAWQWYLGGLIIGILLALLTAMSRPRDAMIARG